MQPSFVELPELKLAGLGARFISILSPNKTNAQVIPALWHDFMRQYPGIPHKVDGVSFGVVERLPASAGKSDPAEMFYIAAAEVSSFEGAPAHLLQRVIPPGQYARFTHKGSLEKLGATMAAIFGEWLPQSGLTLRPDAQLERYDGRFKPNADDSEFDILLPVT